MLKMAIKAPKMPAQLARNAFSVGVAAQVGHPKGQ